MFRSGVFFRWGESECLCRILLDKVRDEWMIKCNLKVINNNVSLDIAMRYHKQFKIYSFILQIHQKNH